MRPLAVCCQACVALHLPQPCSMPCSQPCSSAPRLRCQDMPRLQSGSVGLASSLLHLFVLGAGQTIFIADADAVHASQDEGVS